MERLAELVKRRIRQRRVKELYDENDYLSAYAAHTDLRVKDDPQAAVGGHWDQIGQLQFEFLVEYGLRPRHEMLDIGCGTLRGGRHFIRYLDEGNYTGIDISDGALREARKLVEAEHLAAKQPCLLHNWDMTLKFDILKGRSFDVLLAQSVFTHLLPEHIEECFAHVQSIMKPDASFFFTFFGAQDYQRLSRKDFAYPLSFFETLSRSNGLTLQDLSPFYYHPKGQKMCRVRAAPESSTEGGDLGNARGRR